MRPMIRWTLIVFILAFSIAWEEGAGFQSDEIPEDDDEWGIVGGSTTPKFPERAGRAGSVKSASNGGSAINTDGGYGGASERLRTAAPSPDKKVQFTLEHSFGGSEFLPAGLFTARLRESTRGGQTLSKFRLTRNAFSDDLKKSFQKLLDKDDLYTIRVPSDTLNPGESFVVSSTKARCLVASNFEERFDFHMDHGHIIGVTHGGSISCPYPRPLLTPSHWTFDSLIVVKSGEPAWRLLVTPPVVDVPPDEVQGTEEEMLAKKLPEKSFWSKYWMYIIPIGLIVVNAITQVANMPEEGAPTGQVGGAAQPQRVGGPGSGGGGGRRR